MIILFFCISPDLYAQIPDWEWARSINTINAEQVNDVVSDSLTNDVYVVGQWKLDLNATFPAGAYPSTDFNSTYGLDDGFVAKYDSDGDFLWAFKIGGAAADEITSISIDDAGDIYITGFFGTGENYFAGTSGNSTGSTLTNDAKADFFIAKYNKDGEFIWISRSETDDDVTGLSVFASSSGVFVTGQYSSLCTIGSLTISETFGAADMFMVKYDKDGFYFFDAFHTLGEYYKTGIFGLSFVSFTDFQRVRKNVLGRWQVLGHIENLIGFKKFAIIIGEEGKNNLSFFTRLGLYCEYILEKIIEFTGRVVVLISPRI